LRGRRRERAVLDRLIEEVRGGQSRVLVLRGEPGVGKTALLEYLRERSSGCRIARAAGVESEMELAFASLHQICAPMLHRLDHLPGPQRDALRVAFGQGAGEVPNRFLVGLAVLGLLSDVAEERPLVCLVDDAQWLDKASAQTLAFVARRLLAESVAVVFALREPVGEPELAGLPELVVQGLGDEDARALLDFAIPGRMDEPVRDRILAETRGNPLALLELPRGLGPAELAGGFRLLDAPPLASRIEDSFDRRLHSLPAETQRLLLIAAAEPTGDGSLLWRAAERLEINAEAAGPAETARLIDLGARVRFRHPLVRSASYRAATTPERQAVHRALAEATDPQVDPDRRAWHRAQAAAAPDEAVAGELEASASRAQGRGGVAAAAAFLERATELTPDPGRRGARALAAAQAKVEAGALDTGLELLAIAEMGPLDELQRARLERLRAQIAFARRRGSDAPPLLLEAARRLEPLDASLARETYLDALEAGIFAGRLRSGMRGAAEAARAAPPATRPPRAIDLLLDGLAIRFTEGYAAGAPPLRRALDAFRQEEVRLGVGMRWLWWPVAIELWDDETLHELAADWLRLAREFGALAFLPFVLILRASVHVHAGEFASASALMDEASSITDAAGNPPLSYTSVMLAASRGQEAEALKLIEAAVGDATARGEGRAIGMADYATALLNNGLGRYQDARVAAQRACDHEDLAFLGWALIELIEASARSGAPDLAAVALARLEASTTAVGTQWALGIQARSRALLSNGQAAEALYLEAVEKLGRTRVALHLARAHLLYGEWLRREKRRLDARQQLSAAYDMLSQMGADAFAQRARTELLATGERVRKRSVETAHELTAQEALIARLAAQGSTNPEIGAQLFISARTVEWHLGRVFTKLDVSSRRELRRVRSLLGQETLPA
jgi:DNA-binding CsgD family transcriptional regulator